MKLLMRLVVAAALAAVSGPLLAGAAQATPPRTAVRYSFDTVLPTDVTAGSAASGVVTRLMTMSGSDSAGNSIFAMRGMNGGTVGLVPGVNGQALAFPARCVGDTCPHAILEGIPDRSLNPRARPISYGAAVLLPAEQTTGGANVLQKGGWRSAGLWKLQVDSLEGKPSCAMAGARSRRTYVVQSAVSVADARWHQVACERAGTVFRIMVDGVERGRVAVPRKLSVHNSAPLRLGGNGLSANSDQFHGFLDEAFVTIG